MERDLNNIIRFFARKYKIDLSLKDAMDKVGMKYPDEGSNDGTATPEVN